MSIFFIQIGQLEYVMSLLHSVITLVDEKRKITKSVPQKSLAPNSIVNVYIN